jgi:protein associated with RNAse G/E
MNYTDDIDKIVKYELNELVNMYKEKVGPFEAAFLNKYYEMYINNIKAQK